MAYTPKNIDIFNVVLAGALGGMCDSRSTDMSAVANYANICNVALAIAQEVDTLYSGASAALQQNVIAQVVQGFLNSRQPASTTPGDYLALANAIIAATNETSTLAAALVPASLSSQLSFQARAVVTANIANLAAWTIANADGVTPIEGDIVLLAAQTTAAQNGPYVLGPVAVGVTALTRPGWWAAASVQKSGLDIKVGGEGTTWKNTVWAAMVAGATLTVDTTDPKFFPRTFGGQTTMIGGTFTISGPIFSAKTNVSLSRVGANTTAATVMYAPTNGGGDGRTAGPLGTGQAIVQAVVAAGTINAADVSAIAWTVNNGPS